MINADDLVLRVVEALNSASIPYMIVGSFSSNVYGVYRSTKDADFVIQLGDAKIESVTRALGADFVLEPQMTFETISATSRYKLKHAGSKFDIELFLLSNDAHDQVRFSRRTTGVVGSRQVSIPTAEDVVITKLRWSLHGKRPKDVLDVVNVLAVQFGIVDLDYIRGWCDKHGTRKLFEELLVKAKIVAQ